MLKEMERNRFHCCCCFDRDVCCSFFSVFSLFLAGNENKKKSIAHRIQAFRNVFCLDVQHTATENELNPFVVYTSVIEEFRM